MSIFNLSLIISRRNISSLDKHSNNYVLPLLYSIIIDIFFQKNASRFHHIWGVAAGSLRGAKRRGNLMSLRKHYEVTTLSVIVRDKHHPPRLPSTANLTRELSRLNHLSSIGLKVHIPLELDSMSSDLNNIG